MPLQQQLTSFSTLFIGWVDVDAPTYLLQQLQSAVLLIHSLYCVSLNFTCCFFPSFLAFRVQKYLVHVFVCLEDQQSKNNCIIDRIYWRYVDGRDDCIFSRSPGSFCMPANSALCLLNFRTHQKSERGCFYVSSVLKTSQPPAPRAPWEGSRW